MLVRRSGPAALCVPAVALAGPHQQSGTASEALAIRGPRLLQNRATDLVDKDTIRSEARQVESYVDGHAVG